MRLVPRLEAAFTVSLLAAGTLQQGLMAADHLEGPLAALPPLAGMVVLVSIVFAIAEWRKIAVERTALVLLAILIVVGTGATIIGLANRTAGVGGDILYGLAQLLDWYFLLPCAVAVPIHWLLLMRGREA